MKDLKPYLHKLRANSEHCLTFSQTTLNGIKREVFEVLAATYRKVCQCDERNLERGTRQATDRGFRQR